MEKFLLTSYAPILEVLSGEVLQKEAVPAGKVGEWLRERVGGKGFVGFRLRAAEHVIELLDSREVQAEVDQRAAEIGERLHFWAKIKIGVTGLGVCGAYNAYKAMRELAEDGPTLANSLNFGGNVLSLGGNVSYASQAIQQVREAGARLAERPAAQAAAKGLAEKFGNTAIGLGAASAAVQVVHDLEKARKYEGQARLIYTASATTNLASATVGALHLAGKTGQTGLLVKVAERRAVGAIARGALAITRLGSGPIGWTLIALEATVIALRAWAKAVLAEKKVTDWIARSVWGVRGGFSEDQEHQEFYRLFMTPKVETDVHVLNTLVRSTLVGRIIGPRNVRTIVVALPGWQPQISAYEITHFTDIDYGGKGSIAAKLNDSKLVRVQDGVGYVKFEVENLIGDTAIRYWPNAFTDGDFYIDKRH